MLVRVPDYYEAFHCLAGDCPHTCCEKWEVVVDGETARRYAEMSGTMGDRLRAAMKTDRDGDCCFPLNGGRCPFLDGENLCEIHKVLGEEATSVTCREHPRFTEDYGPFREITLSASCPAAASLLLGTDAPLTFLERETVEPEEAGDGWLDYLLPLRARLLALLEDRSRPLGRRMAGFLSLACEAQAALDDGCEEGLPALAETWSPCESRETEGESLLIPHGLRFLGTLEALEPDWRDLLAQAETAVPTAQRMPLLERVAVYFAFRYILKTVNDGDLLGRAKLCVFAVLAIEKLASVCGLPEALRRFSCEIEHDGDALDALLDALDEDAAFSMEQFLMALGRQDVCAP